MVWLQRIERLLLVLGLLMLAIYVAARIHRFVLSRADVDTFETQEIRSADHRPNLELHVNEPDFTLWAPKKIKAYEESLTAQFTPAVAILRIPRVNIEAPVLEGTGDLTLNRGVGLIEGTSRPGEAGNIGIAGHRDSFFRALKDIGTGDTIEMVTHNKVSKYVVDRIVIVAPNDTSVLGPRPNSLTLVTCYPFYFIGSAPQRYIVQARDNEVLSPRGGPEHTSVEAQNAGQQRLPK